MSNMIEKVSETTVQAMAFAATTSVVGALIFRVDYLAGAVFGASCGYLFPVCALASYLFDKATGCKDTNSNTAFLKTVIKYPFVILTATAITAQVSSVALSIFAAITLYVVGNYARSVVAFAMVTTAKTANLFGL